MSDSYAEDALDLRGIADKRGKISIRAAARKIGVSPATLSRVERGHPSRLDTLRKVRKWFQTEQALHRAVANRDNAVPRTFDTFVAAVREQLEGQAAAKGYNTTNVDGPNQLFEFLQTHTDSYHAIGEIIYKSIRYAKKRNIEDIVKVAAWAFLVYKYHKS